MFPVISEFFSNAFSASWLFRSVTSVQLSDISKAQCSPSSGASYHLPSLLATLNYTIMHITVHIAVHSRNRRIGETTLLMIVMDWPSPGRTIHRDYLLVVPEIRFMLPIAAARMDPYPGIARRYSFADIFAICHLIQFSLEMKSVAYSFRVITVADTP